MDIKHLFIASSILILLAESLQGPGLSLHILNIIFVVFVVIKYQLKTLSSMILPSILRLASYSTPVLFPLTVYQLPLVYLSPLIAVYAIVRYLSLPTEYLGLTTSYLKLVPLGFLLGFVIGLIKYLSLKPEPLTGAYEILALIMVMYVFVGLTEELVFRAIIQNEFIHHLGTQKGILFASIIFAFMHMEISFILAFISFFVGIIVGYIFWRTNNIVIPISIQGTANVMLYGIASFII